MGINGRAERALGLVTGNQSIVSISHSRNSLEISDTQLTGIFAIARFSISGMLANIIGNIKI